MIAFYSGLVVPCELDFWALREGPEPTAEENDRRNSYLLSLVKKVRVQYSRSPLFINLDRD